MCEEGSGGGSGDGGRGGRTFHRLLHVAAAGNREPDHHRPPQRCGHHRSGLVGRGGHVAKATPPAVAEQDAPEPRRVARRRELHRGLGRWRSGLRIAELRVRPDRLLKIYHAMCSCKLFEISDSL